MSVSDRHPVSNGRALSLCVLGCAVLLGCGLRLREYVANRSFWLDEVFLALGILDTPWAELTGPLPHNQVAAPGFVITVKAISTLWGPSELVLRLFPFACGLLAVLMFAILASRMLHMTGACLATLLFALSDYGIYYSTEFKPYIVDVLATLMALRWAISPRPDSWRRQLITAAVAGGILLFSFPAGLILVAAALYRLVRAPERRKELVYLFVVGCVSVPAAVATFLGGARHAMGNKFLYEYWQFAFPRVPPASLSDLNWYVWTTRSLLEHAFDAWSYSLVAAVAAFGLARARHRALLILTLAVPLGAAALRLYPFHGRTVLFVTPVVCLAVAAGVAQVGTGVWRTPLALLLTGILLAPPASVAAYYAWHTRERAPARSMFQLLSTTARSDPDRDVVTTWAAGFMYDYYRRLLPLPPRRATDVPEWSGNSREYAMAIRRALGNRAAWVAFYGVVDWRSGPIEAVHEETPALEQTLNETGRPRLLFKGPGALLFAWEPRIASGDAHHRSHRRDTR